MSINPQSLRGLVAALVVMGTVACGSNGDQTSTAPTPPTTQTPPPAPPSEGLLTGTAIEFTSAGETRAVANLRLRVRAGSSFDGAVGGVELPDVVTDSNGHYQIDGGTNFILFLSTPPGSSHRFLCDEYPLLTNRERGVRKNDLPLVSISWTGNRLPPGMWSPGTSVYGTVSEHADGGLRPVAGATVTLDAGNQDPPATTTATGFYMVCSVVGTDQFRTVSARKAGYTDTVKEIFGGWDFKVDLELSRN